MPLGLLNVLVCSLGNGFGFWEQEGAEMEYGV
jgi:hypothetical protein